jgi:DNA-binding NtrC family response regulator
VVASILGDALSASVTWPPLRDRGEDLRALVLAGLAREGVAHRGTPIGIEDAAFARLADYEYPGDEAELRVLVQRLASSARGELVRAVDVDGLGLPLEPPARSRTGT